MFIQGNEFKDGVICIATDYSSSERAGASGYFQVCNIYIEETEGEECSILEELSINQGKHYIKIEDVIEDLGLDAKVVKYKEI